MLHHSAIASSVIALTVRCFLHEMFLLWEENSLYSQTTWCLALNRVGFLKWMERKIPVLFTCKWGGALSLYPTLFKTKHPGCWSPITNPVSDRADRSLYFNSDMITHTPCPKVRKAAWWSFQQLICSWKFSTVEPGHALEMGAAQHEKQSVLGRRQPARDLSLSHLLRWKNRQSD